MQKILVMGAGKIGSLIAALLAQSNHYSVYLADIQFDSPDILKLCQILPAIQTIVLDAADTLAIGKFIKKQQITAVISSLPYFCNPPIAKLAKEHHLNYFDLTEDVAVSTYVRQQAADATTAFVPQCGLAPGFISMVAVNLMQRFTAIDSVKLRVGALPQHTNNALQYALTWSTDGLINEYGNVCYGIAHGRLMELMPLHDLEEIEIDGMCYEAFNTSGGLGNLAEVYQGKVHTMNYKTLRYPGHCEKMRFLMQDLKLNNDRKTLKRILEAAIPKTSQDVVIIHISVAGQQHNEFREESYVKKIYPQTIAAMQWTAIQLATAAGICGVFDIILSDPKRYSGWVASENIPLTAFLNNQFGKYLA